MAEEQKPNILLVDDDRFLLDIYAMKFKAGGFKVDTFSSSKDALDKIRLGEKFDVIILDIIMPSIDGIDFLQTIRKEKLAENSCVIMLTNQSDDIDKANSLGIDGYIIKATSIPSEVVETVYNIYKKKNQK